MQNHVIDPTYFYDCIEEFSFNYNIYIVVAKDIDDEGYEIEQYALQTIRGSFQSHGVSLSQSKSGNTRSKDYHFYCKSLYRINIGDVIEYKENFYRVNEIDNDYDEWGVRAAKLKMIQLSEHQNLKAYVEYMRGEQLI